MKAWFREDEKALGEISTGDYVLQTSEKGLIHPQAWEYVLENNLEVEFWQQSAIATTVSEPPAPSNIFFETDYESRMQYKVRYYERGPFDHLILVDQSTYNEPVEFEITSDAAKLPALEEEKSVVSPLYRGQKNTKEGGQGKKATLGQLDRVTATNLIIYSPFLLNILKSIMEYSIILPEDDNDDLNGGKFSYPYPELYHHIDELQRYKTDASSLRARHSLEYNKTCDEHIDLLLAYLYSQPGIPIKETRSRWESKTPTTTFAAIWLLLKPGTDVYVREEDESLNAYVLGSVFGGVDRDEKKNTINNYTITVWNLVNGGRKIYRRGRDIQIEIFDNEREITALPVFPVRFVDETDNGALRKKLVGRGQKYFEYSKHPCFLQYTGLGRKEGMKSVR